jgi:hypothetical protein
MEKLPAVAAARADAAKKAAKPFRVRVLWDEVGSLIYAFATKAELEAFCYGLDQYSCYREDNTYYNNPVTVYLRKRQDDGTWGWCNPDDNDDWLDNELNFYELGEN